MANLSGYGKKYLSKAIALPHGLFQAAKFLTVEASQQGTGDTDMGIDGTSHLIPHKVIKPSFPCEDIKCEY